MFLSPSEQLEIVIIVVIILVLVVILILVLIVVLAVLAVLIVLRIVAVVKSVIVVLIIIGHFKFLLLINSYRSSMSKTHKNNTHSRLVLWYYCHLFFCDYSTIMSIVNSYSFIVLFTTPIY